MAATLRVGIIGANARGGWAGESHVPAVRRLDGFELTAVATNARETAEEAAHKFEAFKAYADGQALIADPDIDVVTVATRVPDHRALVLAAIAAGKHVYSEWPLGRSSAEAAEMARAAQTAGVHVAIGLQLRASPAVKAALDLVASGSLGRLLSVSALSTTAGFGPQVPDPFVYLEDPASFANLVTIQGAHTIDLVEALGGGLASLAALTSRQFPEVLMGEAREPHRRDTFDHLLVQGRVAAGVPFAMEVAGGRTGATPFHLDLIGETGRLRLDGGAPRGLQSGRIGLVLDGERVAVDEGELRDLPDAAVNVAGVYAQLRDDVRRGTWTARGFLHAERLSRLVEGILATPERGQETFGEPPSSPSGSATS